MTPQIYNDAVDFAIWYAQQELESAEQFGPCARLPR